MGECKLGLPQNHCDINMLSAALILNKFLVSYECRGKVWPPSYVCRLMFTHPTLGLPAINIHMPNTVVMNKPQQTYLNIINQVLIPIVVVPLCINHLKSWVSLPRYTQISSLEIQIPRLWSDPRSVAAALGSLRPAQCGASDLRRPADGGWKPEKWGVKQPKWWRNWDFTWI